MEHDMKRFPYRPSVCALSQGYMCSITGWRSLGEFLLGCIEGGLLTRAMPAYPSDLDTLNISLFSICVDRIAETIRAVLTRESRNLRNHTLFISGGLAFGRAAFVV
jgi:hypothetical protein